MARRFRDYERNCRTKETLEAQTAVQPEIITAAAENGFTGKIVVHYDCGSATRYELFAYMPDGCECMHSWSSDVKTYDELCEFLDDLPEFMEGGI